MLSTCSHHSASCGAGPKRKRPVLPTLTVKMMLMRLIRNTFLKIDRLPAWAYLLSAVLIAYAPGASAQNALQRVMPADSYQVTIQALNLPALTIDGTTVQLAAGALIFTPENRTITNQALTVDSIVRVEFNGNCQIKKMWLLSDDEIIHRPWWVRMFSGSFQPPC